MSLRLSLLIRFPRITKNYVLYTFEWYEKRGSLHISEININSLKQRYQNNCIEDGSQITIVLKKNGNTKAVHLSNYYQEDVGKIIYLTNALLPEKFKVWYNKEKLIEDLKNCKQKLKK